MPKKIFGKPDVILFGEIHTYKKSGEKEAKLINKYKPEYVLHEAFTKEQSNTIKTYAELLKNSSLKEIADYYGIDLKDIGIDKNILKKIKKEKKKNIESYSKNLTNVMSPIKAKITAKRDVKREGKFPITYKSLISTSIYELNPIVIDCIMEKIDKKIGQTKNQKMIKKLKKMRDYINIIENEFCYGLTEKKKNIAKVIEAAGKNGCEIVGCDIEKNLENVKNLETLIRFFNDLNKYTKELNEMREKTMGETITEYVKRRKTKNPIIAIIGEGHLDKNSKIYPILDKNGITYKIKKTRKLKMRKKEALEYLIDLASS